jgi:hypothetical protein
MVEVAEDTNVLIGKVALKRLRCKKCLAVGVALINCIGSITSVYIVQALRESYTFHICIMSVLSFARGYRH